MKRYELFKNENLHFAAQELCEAMSVLVFEDKDFCELCPMNDKCWRGHNGWEAWLKEEI